MSSRGQSEEREGYLIRIRARPHTSYISHNRSVLATGRDGFIFDDPDHGLFVRQTRVLSRYRYLINGQLPAVNVVSNVTSHSWLGYYLAVAPGAQVGSADQGSGQVPAISTHPLEIRVARRLGDGLHETITVTNFSADPTELTLMIEVGADFADQSETRERLQRGRLSRKVVPGALRFDYTGEHAFTHQSERGRAKISRGVEIAFDGDGTAEGDGIRFEISLRPRETWRTSIAIAPLIDGDQLAVPGGGDHNPTEKRAQRARLFLSESTQFEAPGHGTLTPSVLATLEQARIDLSSLRLFDFDHGERSWIPAAGLPLYIALFGRDMLTTGWQAGIVAPDLMVGSLNELARWQGTESNDWRDEQPGKMLHEAHDGPLAALNYNPRARSYSSITTSGLYAFMVAELWHWTGDKNLIRPLIEPALRALRWVDTYGDPDGDGFFEYATRSPLGPRNQAWKDSADAIVYEDGRLVDPPIATCEEQAFVYVAKLHMSEVMWWLGEKTLARRLFESAGELKKRFNEAFWMPDANYFAMALDSRKEKVTSIGSNAGHCVAAAIIDSSLVVPTVNRMFADDLFSGWGIRTLSADHPRYNPYSYHLGSIWPVEHGTFALGFMRYELHERVEQISRAQFDAAALFDFHRLPELFGGQPRDSDHPFPGIYPNANSPQAWSASSVFCLIQAMLGLYPYAPLRILLVDPHLPAWLPEITLRNLRVGRAVVTIRFWRKSNGKSTYRILDQRGKLHLIRQPTPWSLTSSYAERLRDGLESLIPGK